MSDLLNYITKELGGKVVIRDANIQSKKELCQRLLNGEVFALEDDIMKYDDKEWCYGVPFVAFTKLGNGVDTDRFFSSYNILKVIKKG